MSAGRLCSVRPERSQRHPALRSFALLKNYGWRQRSLLHYIVPLVVDLANNAGTGASRVLSFAVGRALLCLTCATGLLTVGRVVLSQPASAAREVRIGRISKLDQGGVEKEAAPFLNYLQSQVPGYHFRVVHLRSDAEAVAAAAGGNLEFLYVTPSVFVQLEVQSSAVAIATAKRYHGQDITLKYVGGAIFCRADRKDIRRLADLRGKRVMGLNPLALGGWISALREFKDENIDPARDFSQLRFGVNHVMVAAAVANGDVDVGVLSISEVPLLYAGGQFSRQQFRVLPPRVPYPELVGLPVAASTRLYPGTAFVRMPHADDDLAVRVATALFQMPEKSGVASSMLVAGWTLPANYQPVHECLKELGMSPYEDFGKVSLRRAVGQHWESVTLSLMVLLGALMIAMIAALRLNSKLRGSQLALRQELEQRKQAEMTLAYQAKLLAQTSDAVVAGDAENRVTFWNESAEKLFGWRSDEVMGRRIEDITPWTSSNPSREEVRRRIETQGAWSGEVSFQNRAGAVVHIEMAISRVRDSDGRMVGTVAGMRDLTERKRLEEQLVQSQKMQAIGLLAGGVAHDFNNLLTVINGYAQLAADACRTDPEIRESLEEVLRAGHHGAELTQQLLAFGRKQVLQLQILDLNQLTRDTERLLQRLIGEDIELRLELEEGAGRIKADPGQMQQVIMNLAVNARDAMPHGGRLTLRTRAVEFDVSHTRLHPEIQSGLYVLLMVIDEGHGMDKTTTHRIFEPFFTTKEKGRGTGLGLSTVYGIVQQSGGHIWVDSELNRGTTFTVCLPAANPSEPALSSTAAEPAPPGKEALLLVEDKTQVRELASKILKSLGYCVLEAENGANAKRLFEVSEQPVDLLITDVIMPGMTGTELAAELRARRPALRVLFMSGYADGKVVQPEALDANTAFLQKPFTPDLLARRVRDLLGPH